MIRESARTALVSLLAMLTAGTCFARPQGTEMPRLEHRGRVYYLAVRERTPMGKLGEVTRKGLTEVFGWMRGKHMKASGAPFIRYLVIDMPRELDIDLCVPVAAPVRGSGRIHAGVLPAGEYATLTHTGAPAGLVQANGDLQAWAKQHGIRLESRGTPKGDAFQGRAEFYLTDPQEEPDPDRWRTEIVYLTASTKRQR
jgi:effector-binding domain-containing protein